MKTNRLLFTAIASIAFITGAQAQIVNIPDANFKAALVNNSSINTNMDAEIQVSEASVFNGAINVSQLNITDLTGIEAFVALDSLDCSLNQIASLNVSANIALTYLNCSGNSDYNDFSWTNIDSLDVSANSLLTTLICSGNGLLSLNTTGLTALTYLDCSYNERGYLEGSGLGGNWFHISYPILNFTGNTALTYLNCSRNGMTSLTLSGFTALDTLYCFNNQLTSLDLSANTALTTLDCSANQLSNLNVNNGNNMNMVSFGANNNPNLSCIEVDSAAWSNINWPYIDPTASFSENCSGAGISDINESNAPMFYPNPTTGTLYLSEQSNITLIDLSGKLLLEEKNTNQLDLSALPAGMYFLRVGENNNQLVKVIKE